jgi:SAM-dependent methyltransferase
VGGGCSEAKGPLALRVIPWVGGLSDRKGRPHEDDASTGSMVVAFGDRMSAADIRSSLGNAAPTSRSNTDPFERHHLRRYAFAWRHLADRTGSHLDLGCGTGPLLIPLSEQSPLLCVGADPHPGYLAEVRAVVADLPLVRIGVGAPLPFASGSFDSISLLDVLEHVPDENGVLAEAHRLLAPGGLLLVTVPAKHVFSFMDPDQVKFRFPSVHRAVYRTRFGREAYQRRFVDHSDHLHGDMSLGRHDHTNYRQVDLARLLQAAGFVGFRSERANLFWRFLQVPALLTGGRIRRWIEHAILVDGRIFSSANLFVVAYRPPNGQPSTSTHPPQGDEPS